MTTNIPQHDLTPQQLPIESLRSLGRDSLKVLIPIENKRSFFDVSAEILENVDPIFYGEVKQAAFKALDLV